MRRILYLCTVLEEYRFSSNDIKIDCVHVDSGGELGVAKPSVQLLGAFLADEADGWMMANLLQKDRSAIDKTSLQSLTENGVQWLIEDVTWLQKRKRCYYHILHSLDWAGGCCGTCHINWTMD